MHRQISWRAVSDIPGLMGPPDWNMSPLRQLTFLRNKL